MFTGETRSCRCFQVAEARREADEKRTAKYAKMERQREEVRQNIREKVIINLVRRLTDAEIGQASLFVNV